MNAVPDHKCTKCGALFRDAYNLRRHHARKRTCEPIIDQPEVTVVNAHTCRYCGRAFTMATAMYRHVRTRCKIANSDEGMEKLLDHTLQRQLAEQQRTTTMLQAQVAELSTLLKSQLAVVAPAAQHLVGVAQIYNAPVTNIAPVTNTTNNNTVIINAWDGDRRIGVDLGHILAAFADNAKLREYARLGDHELTDPAIAPPYVTELLMDLTKRAHADPTARNVYLNPRRADQVLVHKKSGTWEVLPLAEATRLLFDGVVQGILAVSRNYDERRQLPLEAQNALSMAGLLYDDEPEEYARRAKAPMAAHLENVAPDAV